MTSVPLYRAMMVEFERQRLALGYSMATVDDLAGTQDGYYSKMIYPDTPSGRQARWETVHLVAEALFGRGLQLGFVEGNRKVTGMPVISKGASTNTLKIRHWRHRKHFSDLGKKGAAKFLEGKTKAELSIIMRKRAKKRWRRARAAKRQGEAHKAANAEKRVT